MNCETGLDHIKHGFGDKGWSQDNDPQHETFQVATWPRFHAQRPTFENDRHDNDPVDIIWGLRIPTALSYEHWIVTISHHTICQLPRAEGQSTCEARQWMGYKRCQWLSVQIMVEHFQVSTRRASEFWMFYATTASWKNASHRLRVHCLRSPQIVMVWPIIPDHWPSAHYLRQGDRL